MILEAAHAMQQLEEEREDEKRFEMAMFNDEDNDGGGGGGGDVDDNDATASLNVPNISLSPSHSTSIQQSSLKLSSNDLYSSDLTHGSDVVLAGMYMFEYHHHLNCHNQYYHDHCRN